MESTDILGTAMIEFLKSGISHGLVANTSYGSKEEYDLSYFFREEEEMPDLELYGLSMCSGRILDIGAGAGSHALLLQKRGHNVTAMDSSLGCVNVMLYRGVSRVLHMDFNNIQIGGYHTLILLMNGIGITGNLGGFMKFLKKAEEITDNKAQIIFDSTDISYFLTKKPDSRAKYVGEVKYQFEYHGVKGPWFEWLFIGQDQLYQICNHTRWVPQVVFEHGDGNYLVRLFKK